MPVKNDKEKTESASVNSNAKKTTRASRLNKDRVYFGSKGKPTKAQLALIERYKVDTNKALVDNTLEQIVSERIEDIKEAVDNMIQYGDPKIFKVLPKVLDEKIRAYGLFAQEYFGKSIREMDGTEVFIVPATFKLCNKCGKYKPSSTAFYESFSEIYNGTLPICKDCTRELFVSYYKKYKDLKECIVLLSQKLDFILYEPVLNMLLRFAETEEGKSQITTGEIVGKYLTDLWLQCHINDIPKNRRTFAETNFGGVPFKCIKNRITMPTIYDDKFEVRSSENSLIDDDDDKLPPIKKLRRKWGEMYDDKELKFLENIYNQYLERSVVDSLVKERLLLQVCYEELGLYTDRQSGRPVDKRISGLRALLKDADLIDKPNSSNSSGSQFGSLGEFIRHAEQNAPIIVENPKFKDVDGIKKLWKSMVGALIRTLGKHNEYTDQFEESYKPYTADVLASDQGDTDE